MIIQGNLEGIDKKINAIMIDKIISQYPHHFQFNKDNVLESIKINVISKQFKEIDTLLDSIHYDDEQLYEQHKTSVIVHSRNIQDYNNKFIKYVFTIDDWDIINEFTHVDLNKIYTV